MSVKKILASALLLLACVTAYAQFQIGMNQHTGAINRISHPADENRMNWIFSSTPADSVKWQQPWQDWGMGQFQLDEPGATIVKWDIPVQKNISDNKATLLYKTDYLNVLVNRYAEGHQYVETYTFTNHTNRPISIKKLSIFTPFNDNYPDARICATNRCNAHIWAGMHASYVNALRMNGTGPHLGLVLTKGALQGYAIENRSPANGWSNSRGTMALETEAVVLKPGQTYVLQWKMFWHTGWGDFFVKAKNLGFVQVKADKYVIAKGEKITIQADAVQAAGLKQKKWLVTGDKPGEYSQKIYFANGKKHTTLNYLVISSPQQLMEKRARFIVEHQQMNDTTDKRYGAYMVYDNDLDKIVTDASKTVSQADRNEGAERLGMGVFIAKWLRNNQDEAVKKSLLRYAKFVRTKLQDPEYKTFSNVTNNSYRRGYNYPWVASFYLEVYQLTREQQYLLDYYGTMRKFFKEFGPHFYGIDIRIKEGIDALAAAGLLTEKAALLNDYKLFGDFIIQNGIYYPKHEVNYEQSIVAPAVTALCELYLVTKEAKYLAAAKLQMPSLEAFNGQQPDVHLYDIGIRHWDGYWFGKQEKLGDTMPHYWSALTGIAFYRYYQCTGDKKYAHRAKGIVENNLLNFKEDGKASCAYLYPETIGGKPGKYYDSFANDQDWALAYYLDIMNED